MMVKLLSQEQYDLIKDNLFNETNYFLSIMDANNNWTLELSQVEQITNVDFFWVKDLPEIEYKRKVVSFPIRQNN
jgi:hypothetical protein